MTIIQSPLECMLTTWQISQHILWRSTSDVAALQGELAHHSRQLDHIYSSSFKKFSEVPVDNPITRAVDNPATIVSDIREALAKACKHPNWAATPAKCLASHLASVSAAKPLISSNFNWPVLNKKNTDRDLFRPSVASALEYYAAQEYRHPLLKTQANRFRHHLSSALKDEDDIVSSRMWSKDHDDHLAWWDGIYHPIAQLGNVKKNKKLVEAAAMRSAGVKSIAQIIDKVTKSPAAYLTSARLGDGSKVVANEVLQALKALVSVGIPALRHLYITNDIIGNGHECRSLIRPSLTNAG